MHMWHKVKEDEKTKAHQPNPQYCDTGKCVRFYY
jgi:hypothetical protein